MAVIGITIGTALLDSRRRHHCPEEYTTAVAAAGGQPVLLPAPALLDDPGRILKVCDGLLFSGGGDLAPDLYGQERQPACDEPDRARDLGELALTRLAVAAGKPLLAICRGIQVLNVALGGDLVQDLPAAGLSGHMQTEARGKKTHPLILAPDAPPVLPKPDSARVNSLHHQSVGRLGEGLCVAARAPDGVIEALILPGRPVLGVQWHPEAYADRDAEAAALFRWLNLAAEKV